MSTKEFYVYEHWRSDRNEIFYVGKGTGRRGYDFKNSRNRYYKAVVAKLSRTGTFVEVKIVAKGLCEQEAFQIEETRFKFWAQQGAELTNISSGGIGGHTGARHSEEWKRRTSERWRQWFSDPKNREIHGAKFRGRVLSEEQKEKLRGPKSVEHVEAMRRGAIGRKRPIPRTIEHRQRQIAGLARFLSSRSTDPAYLAKKAAEKASREAARIAAREAKQEERRIKDAQVRFLNFIRALSENTAIDCRRCRVLKAPEDFPISKQKRNGRGSYCKDCGIELAVKYRVPHQLDATLIEN